MYFTLVSSYYSIHFYVQYSLNRNNVKFTLIDLGEPSTAAKHEANLQSATSLRMIWVLKLTLIGYSAVVKSNYRPPYCRFHNVFGFIIFKLSAVFQSSTSRSGSRFVPKSGREEPKTSKEATINAKKILKKIMKTASVAQIHALKEYLNRSVILLFRRKKIFVFWCCKKESPSGMRKSRKFCLLGKHRKKLKLQ